MKHLFCRSAGSVGLMIAVYVSLVLGTARPVDSAVFNCPAGDVDCLIAALNTANANDEADTINLSPGGTYTLTTKLPNIEEGELTVNGNGATVERSSESATPDFGILRIDVSGFPRSIRLNDLTIKGGGGRSGGGGIFILSSEVTLSNSTVSNNTRGGGISYNDSGGSFDILTLINSTVSNNTGGGILYFPPVPVGTGGAIVKRSTPEVGMVLINSTVSNNTGVGIFYDPIVRASSIPFILQNSIIANNVPGGDCGGRKNAISLGHNIDSDGSCNLTADSDLPNTDPLLDTLQDNGGPTETHAVMSGSPAIDAVPIAACSDAFNGSLILSTAMEADTPIEESEAPLGATVQNGDFLITRSGVNTILGNGIDETTTWSFAFAADRNFADFIASVPLTTALLTLTLTPKSGAISTDAVGIGGQPQICSPATDFSCVEERTDVLEDLPLGSPAEIQLDLLNFYSPDTILNLAMDPKGIPMFYADDAIISSAQLVLSTTTDQREVPRPQGTACDIGAFESQAISRVDLTGAAIDGEIPTGRGILRQASGEGPRATFEVSNVALPCGTRLDICLDNGGTEPEFLLQQIKLCNAGDIAGRAQIDERKDPRVLKPKPDFATRTLAEVAGNNAATVSDALVGRTISVQLSESSSSSCNESVILEGLIQAVR